MTAITDAANNAVRDFVTAGVPASGDHEPVKSEVRAVFGVIDAALSSLGVNGAITVKKATRALLYADLAHVADTLAVVYNDSTAAQNGIYAKSGGSGSGSWSLTALALPSSFGTDLAEALATQEAAAAAAAEAAAYAEAAAASADAAASSVTDAENAVTAAEAAASDAAGSVDAVAASAAAAAVSAAAADYEAGVAAGAVTAAAAWAAEAEADAATAAALAGVERIFNTKALANAGLASVTANAHIIVQVDESQSNLKTLYQKVSGAYVFVDELNSLSNPTVVGDLELTGALVVPDDQPIRIGTDAMPSLGTDGTYNFPGANVAIGLEAGFSCVEGGMVAVGWQAGYSAGAVGDESAITAVGWKALKLTTTGHATGFGWGVGQRNTTGNMVGVGDESLSFNTTSHSVAVGYYAGHSNVTGEVTCIGYQAGRQSGPDCTMTLVGYGTGYYNEAADLTAVGHRASELNTTGVGNSSFGHLSLNANTTGANNTALGTLSLLSCTTGFENTVAGAAAGRSITTGYQNTFIGRNAGFNGSQKVDAINSTALGYGAFTTYDNSVVIGGSAVTRVTTYGSFGPNGKVNPTVALDVRANTGSSTVAQFLTDAGFGFSLRINDGADALGYGANYRHGLRYGGGESFAFVEGTTKRLVIAGTTGRIGINETAPDYGLDVNGTFGFTPGASVTPVDNGDVVFELTSNTSLTVKAKGSDGTVRSVVLTLA